MRGCSEGAARLSCVGMCDDATPAPSLPSAQVFLTMILTMASTGQMVQLGRC